MTMYAFSKSFFRPVHFKEPEMTLFIIYVKCTTNIVAAYWADSIRDAFDAAVGDGFNPGAILPLQATPEQAALYHGPDFEGRKCYEIELIEPFTGDVAETMHVASDCMTDALRYAFSLWGKAANYRRVLNAQEASELLEPGWDQ